MTRFSSSRMVLVGLVLMLAMVGAGCQDGKAPATQSAKVDVGNAVVKQTVKSPASAPAPAGTPLPPPPPLTAEAKAMGRIIAGESVEIDLAGIKLAELPASFDINPAAARDREYRKKHGIGLVLKNPDVELSKVKIGGDELLVTMVPFVRTQRGTGVQVNHKLYDPAQPQTTKATGGKLLITKMVASGQISVSYFAMDKAGRELDKINRDWAVIVAVAGDQGAVFYSGREDDQVAPKQAGYRRFRLETQGEMNDVTGWRCLTPVIGR